MINIFSSDPDRARAEKSAHLDFEIKRLEGKEQQLKEDIKQMESEMESSIEVKFQALPFFYSILSSVSKLFQAYHQMRSHQITNAFHLFAASQVSSKGSLISKTALLGTLLRYSGIGVVRSCAGKLSTFVKV